MRADLQLPDQHQKAVQKVMVANLEVEMSEFTYDVKIYQL